MLYIHPVIRRVVFLSLILMKSKRIVYNHHTVKFVNEFSNNVQLLGARFITKDATPNRFEKANNSILKNR